MSDPQKDAVIQAVTGMVVSDAMGDRLLEFVPDLVPGPDAITFHVIRPQETIIWVKSPNRLRRAFRVLVQEVL